MAGVSYEALGSGILARDDPRRFQKICNHLTPAKMDKLLLKWLAKLPHRLMLHVRRDGVSILQAEFSLTQVLDRPLSGRIFFEDVIGHNSDLGRPDRVQLLFDRRVRKATLGRFRTHVLTNGVTPSPPIDYKLGIHGSGSGTFFVRKWRLTPRNR